MAEYLTDSELIINPDGSVYHLNIPPGVLSPLIITVGDPDRVVELTKYFDRILFESKKREFHSAVGTYKGLDLTVISTGIGTDNVDIVFNEIDALFNVDFATRRIKDDLQQLSFVRLGTSGIIEEETKLELGDIVFSKCAYGFDGLCQFYTHNEITKSSKYELDYYFVEAGQTLSDLFSSWKKSVTMTMPGFYGPQNRSIRINNVFPDFKPLVKELGAQNLEMETAGIYAMSKLLGHEAISIQALLANRPKGSFHPNPKKIVDQMIVETLDWLVKNWK